jgi:hypothetical protein
VPRFDDYFYYLLPLLGYEQGQNKNKNCLFEAEQEAREKQNFALATSLLAKVAFFVFFEPLPASASCGQR